MKQKPISRIQLSISLGFTLSLLLMMGVVFLDGYANAHTLKTDLADIPMEVQNEIFVNQIVPDHTNPLPTIHTTFDFVSDDSLQKYLDLKHPFNDIHYVPSDLAAINSNFTANDARKFKLRSEAGDAFADMARHFWNEFSGDRLGIISAYRSKSYQDGLIKKGCNLNACAKGGTSEHQAGLALDLKVVTKGGRTISLDTPSIYTDWLHAYAQKWGFHNTYQKGVAIDGKIVEGRHRRYMGVQLATILFNNQQTIAEYYQGIED